MVFLPRKQTQVWDPFREMEQLQHEMNRLFNGTLSKSPADSLDIAAGAWVPAVDVTDTKDKIVIRADMPGLKKEEIDVSIEDDVLILKGEKKKEEEVKEVNYYRCERVHGSFYRAVPLPSTVDSTKIQASYKDGVLQMTLPKKEEAKPKQIKIELN